MTELLLRVNGIQAAFGFVSNIAVVGSPNSPDFYEASNAFDDLVESSERLTLCEEEFPFDESFPVHEMPRAWPRRVQP